MKISDMLAFESFGHYNRGEVLRGSRGGNRGEGPWGGRGDNSTFLQLLPRYSFLLSTCYVVDNITTSV